MAACGRPCRKPLECVSELETPRTWPSIWKCSWNTPICWARWELARAEVRRVTIGLASSSAAKRSTPHCERTPGEHSHAVLQRRAHHRRFHPVDSAAESFELGVAALRRRFHGCQPRAGARIRRSAYRGVGRPSTPPIGSALERVHRPRPRRIYRAHGCRRHCLPAAAGKATQFSGRPSGCGPDWRMCRGFRRRGRSPWQTQLSRRAHRYCPQAAALVQADASHFHGKNVLVPALPLSRRCHPLRRHGSAVSRPRGQPVCQPPGDRAGLPAGFPRFAEVLARALDVVPLFGALFEWRRASAGGSAGGIQELLGRCSGGGPCGCRLATLALRGAYRRGTTGMAAGMGRGILNTAVAPGAVVWPAPDYSTVEDSVRDLFRFLGLDAANPFGRWLRPGMTVVVKPNWVKHEFGDTEGRNVLFTHASLVRVLIDAALKALAGAEIGRAHI